MPSLPVVCTYCNETIYDYTGPTDKLAFKAEHFAPRGSFPAPDAASKLACPNCGERWVAVSRQIDSIRMAIDPATRGSGTVKY
jgi:hypothetical protein